MPAPCRCVRRSTRPPERPGRPERPQLVPPSKMKKRSLHTVTGASPCCTRSAISNSMPSISRSISSPASPTSPCRAPSSTAGCWLPSKKPSISAWCASACATSTRTMATCPPMTVCGRRPTHPQRPDRTPGRRAADSRSTRPRCDALDARQADRTRRHRKCRDRFRSSTRTKRAMSPSAPSGSAFSAPASARIPPPRSRTWSAPISAAA